MANRRELLKGGIALAASAAAPPALRRAAANAASVSPLVATTIVIADRTLPESPAFGAAAAARGYRVRNFDGDVGPLWMNLIELRLRAGTVSMLGITSAATLFCIETLARDYGAMPVARIAARDAEADLRFARLLVTDASDALPPFAHVLARLPPQALMWRIETHSRSRSILATQG